MKKIDVLICVVLAHAASTHAAMAADPEEARFDGLYGRLRGDLDLSAAAGPALVPGGAQAAFGLRAIYLGTAGLYATYATSFDDQSGPATFALGISLRPLFLPRWGLDLETGPPLLDLTLDAISFDLGVLWPSNGHERGPGFELGLGTEVPLLAKAAGPWLGVRGVIRYRESQLGTRAATVQPDLGPAVFFTFAWHVIVDAHLVDAGDSVPR